MAFPWLAALGMGAGAVGALTSDSMSPEQREMYEMLKKRLAGIDPKLLERMRARMRNAIGNQAAGLSASTSARLRRQSAPVAKQEEVMDKLNTRRIGGTSDALLGIDEMNERYKQSAAGMMAGFNTQSNEGQGFANLFGSGMNLLMNKPNASFNPQMMYQLNQAKKRGGQFEQMQFPQAR